LTILPTALDMLAGVDHNYRREMTKDISDILKAWPVDDDDAAARVIVGDDGKELLQLRIDLGILQMYFDGRPDGERPFGQASLLDHLQRVTASQPDTTITAETWAELDREVMQYYHRRRALLIIGAGTQGKGERRRAIEYFERAVDDADHNLQIMDFVKAHCDDQEYVEGHERYRPFVLMHRTLAEAQSELLKSDPDEAIENLKQGIEAIEEVYVASGADDLIGQDPSILQLRALEQQVRKEHDITQTLHEQLTTAITNEEFERAADLRDQLKAKQDAKRDAEDLEDEASDTTLA
jgi:tetratricopeptide (TPR) repeat protein